MTSTTRPRHPDGAQPIPVGVLRHMAAMPLRFGRWLGAGAAKFRYSGQLGASADKEIGRGTGGI